MTPIERQILENQKTIMYSLWRISKEDYEKRELDERRVETTFLLQKKSKEVCCEMPKGCGKGFTKEGKLEESVYYPYQVCGKFDYLCKECVKEEKKE